MKAYVDPELCNGCGPCVDTCPEAFGLNEEGIAVVKVDEVPPDLQEACKEAYPVCNKFQNVNVFLGRTLLWL
ncbi:MAG: ferredoxin [Planctomycetota bacterium]|jgi:ferredoxin